MRMTRYWLISSGCGSTDYWTASSTLVIKVPSQGLSFVLLANSDGPSARYPLAAGRLDASPWAREFLETFAIARLPVP
jgi:hypothetical protein